MVNRRKTERSWNCMYRARGIHRKSLELVGRGKTGSILWSLRSLETQQLLTSAVAGRAVNQPHLPRLAEAS